MPLLAYTVFRGRFAAAGNACLRRRPENSGRLKPMYTFRYQVESIDGDYANLRRIDAEEEDLKLVARALLPPEIAEGTKLLYEMMQYTVLEE